MIIASICLGVIALFIGYAIYRARRNDKLKISFKESMDLVDLPVVTFYNNTGKTQTKLNFLLDTGANYNIINSTILPNVKYKQQEESGVVFGMEGTTKEVSYIDMQIHNRSLEYNTTFQVLDMTEAFNRVKKENGVTINGILGSKFFETYKYIIDFNKLVAYPK